MKRFLPSIFIVCSLIVILLLQNFSAQRDKKNSVTALSSGSAGMSIFVELSKKFPENKTQILKRPVLSSPLLQDKDLLMFLSPHSNVSEREAKIIKEFVDNGGTLLLSFHNRETEINLKEFYKAFKIEGESEEDSHFVDGQTTQIPSTQANVLSDSTSPVSFYSALTFSGCTNPSFDCYEKEFVSGKGKVILISGLPPFSNALILRDENRKTAFSLIHAYHKIIIDEYRHFYSDKTVWDLFFEPAFSLPIFGLIAMALLFFLYGAIGFEDLLKGSEEPRFHRPSHVFNERILSGLVQQTKAKADFIEGHALFLRNLFPHEQTMIDDVVRKSRSTQWLEGAKTLALLHKKILEKRRGI